MSTINMPEPALDEDTENATEGESSFTSVALRIYGTKHRCLNCLVQCQTPTYRVRREHLCTCLPGEQD